VGWILVVVSVCGGLFLLDQLGLWAERHGWIYWRKKRSKCVGSGAMFAVAADIYQPNRALYVQEMESKRIVRLQTPSPDLPPEDKPS